MEAPLLPPPSSSFSSAAATTTLILTRVAIVIAVASLSLWANHEASKDIDITVVATGGTPAGRLFDLMYVSNGRAARILRSATLSVESALFPDDRFPKKHVTHVTLQLASRNLTAGDVSILPGAGAGAGDYVISVSPSVLSVPGGTAAAVRRGVAKMWLWDGQGAAPAGIVDAVSDYLAAVADGKNLTLAGGGGDAPYGPCCAGGGGGFVGYCEERMPGFVARLNRGMRRRSSDGRVEEASGSPELRECAVYRSVHSVVVAGGAAGDVELWPAL